MRISKGGYLLIYATILVCIHSASTYRVHENLRSHDVQASDTMYSMRNIRDDGFERKLIPIKAPRVASWSFAMPLEPDAEMLPAHYTGVKPPGVDHMELKRAESRILKARSEDQSGKSGRSGARVSAKQESTVAKSDKGHERVGSVEKGRKGDQQEQRKRMEYAEAGGKKKTSSERENDSNYRDEEARKEGGAEHRTKTSGNKHGKAHGYHNVYHKDESKKDHDFFDNDHHGGHLKKHGRYNERHVAIEGTFKKGGSNGSGFQQAEQKKQGISENSQAGRETKGHNSRRGYDGFFKNFQGFAKEAARGEGKKFGFVEPQVR